jgi:uncharacterized protein (TIGR02246 family)
VEYQQSRERGQQDRLSSTPRVVRSAAQQFALEDVVAGYFRIAFVLVLAPLVFAASPEKEVQQASDALFAARQHGDAAAFAALIAEDGIVMVPGLPDASGRSAVLEQARRRFEGNKTEDVKIHRRDIKVAGDQAYELCWYAETNRQDDQGFRMEARHFILWTRGADNVWRAQRYLYNFAAAEPLP